MSLLFAFGLLAGLALTQASCHAFCRITHLLALSKPFTFFGTGFAWHSLGAGISFQIADAPAETSFLTFPGWLWQWLAGSLPAGSCNLLRNCSQHMYLLWLAFALLMLALMQAGIIMALKPSIVTIHNL